MLLNLTSTHLSPPCSDHMPFSYPDCPTLPKPSWFCRKSIDSSSSLGFYLGGIWGLVFCTCFWFLYQWLLHQLPGFRRDSSHRWVWTWRVWRGVRFGTVGSPCQQWRGGGRGGWRRSWSWFWFFWFPIKLFFLLRVPSTFRLFTFPSWFRFLSAATCAFRSLSFASVLSPAFPSPQSFWAVPFPRLSAPPTCPVSALACLQEGSGSWWNRSRRLTFPSHRLPRHRAPAPGRYRAGPGARGSLFLLFRIINRIYFSSSPF